MNNPAASIPVARPTTTSVTAVAALLLGIASWSIMPLCALPAIIVGHYALIGIRRSGGAMDGRGLAWAALILGYPMFLFILAFFAAFIFIGAAIFGAWAQMMDAHLSVMREGTGLMHDVLVLIRQALERAQQHS